MEKQEQWNPSFLPFETNYNDHFETPMQAYLDVKPLLDWFSTYSSISNSSTSKSHKSDFAHKNLTLYDPYYCNGRTSDYLKQLGYNVVHEARDFYLDIANNEVPRHDILISNPPYSDTHKIQCLNYCFQSLCSSVQLGDEGKLFLLLMPSYVATKQYFRVCLDAASILPSDIVYVIPSSPYKYDHPSGTGKTQCPFKSLWFCAVGAHRVDSLVQYWNKIPGKRNQPQLATSLTSLIEKNIIQEKIRPNPKRRSKNCAKFMYDNLEQKTRKKQEETTNKIEDLEQKARKNREETTSKIKDKTDSVRNPDIKIKKKRRF